VATPIGNLEDISMRALRVLAEVDLIAAEDTRKTSILLNHYAIRRPLVSYHDFNKEKRTPQLLKRLAAGADIALVTEAGSPCISDPGYYVISRAIASGHEVHCVPGPSAVICALQLSGLPSDRFSLEGFPPKTASKRARMLESLSGEDRTMIFFESPRRVVPTLRAMLEIMDDRPAALCRELTKMNEEVLRGTISTVLSEIEGRSSLKGEIVIVLSGRGYWEKLSRKAAKEC